MWSSTPPQYLSDVTALAFDFSLAEDGVTPQAIPPMSAINIYLTMRAPDFSEGFDAHGNIIYAWNNAHMMMHGLGKDLHFGYTAPTQVEINALNIRKDAYLHDGSHNNGHTQEPTLVNNQEKLTYKITVTNVSEMTIPNIDVRDVIPDRLEIRWDDPGFEISYAFSSGSTGQVNASQGNEPIAADGNPDMVTLWQNPENHQELMFNVFALAGGESITFTIPTYINTGGQTTVFVNEATIESFDGIDVEIHSNETYHRTAGGFGLFYFNKLDAESHEPIGNTHFKLYQYVGGGSPALALLEEENHPDWNLVGDVVSDEFGLVSFGTLGQGMYQLVEVGAEGYFVPKGQWRVELGAGMNEIPNVTLIPDAYGKLPPDLLSLYQITFVNTYQENQHFRLFQYQRSDTPNLEYIIGPWASADGWEVYREVTNIALGEKIQFRFLESGYYQLQIVGLGGVKEYRFYTNEQGEFIQVLAGPSDFGAPPDLEMEALGLYSVIGDLVDYYDHVLFNMRKPEFDLPELSGVGVGMLVMILLGMALVLFWYVRRKGRRGE